ncbi:hypothetical protein BV22DRAFT_1077993 [Leucogyrophana mollusca]|uniref:Uncharacterized protein n=1 Tax=Leucogyrophana mollusca TaxID=85980 RepID=A0ACB8BXU9_9AGAM|nr:hypothetical protein BV22DRAFT_1077993 [Leucogyrophana mollusca]
MTDKQKAIVALTLASETCTTALSALISRNQVEKADPQSTDLPVILKDLDSLLSLIYASTNKLSLALKPSSPTYSASLSVLQDITKHTSGLIHCTDLLNPEIHGATLRAEITYSIENIIRSIRALVQTFLNFATRGPPRTSSGAAGEEYLVRTGTVHDLIDKARAAKGIPKDNVSAVSQKWKQDRASLDDGIREVGDMIEDAINGRGDDGIADEEDGWDELGLGDSGLKLDKDEVERTKNVHAILRLTTLLHKRVHLDLLSSPSSVPNISLDALLAQSHALLAASDDFIATLYPPQIPSSVAKELLSFIDVIRALQTSLQIFLPTTDSLGEQLGALNIQGGKAEGRESKSSKNWFDTCFDQIYKLATSLGATLTQDNIPNTNGGT